MEDSTSNIKEVSIMPEECLRCDCYDSDMGCTCPSIDKWYACPLEPEPTAEDFMTEEELREYRGGGSVGESIGLHRSGI